MWMRWVWSPIETQGWCCPALIRMFCAGGPVFLLVVLFHLCLDEAVPYSASSWSPARWFNWIDLVVMDLISSWVLSSYFYSAGVHTLPPYLHVISWAASPPLASPLNSLNIWNLSASFPCLSFHSSVKRVTHGNAAAVRPWPGPEDPRREQVRWGGEEAGGHGAGHQGGKFSCKNICNTLYCVTFSLIISRFFHKRETFSKPAPIMLHLYRLA